MNKTVGIIIALVVVLGGAYLISRSPDTTDTGSNTGNTNTAAKQGRVVFSVTDAAADMGTISEITLTVSKVEMHSEASGWVTASTQTKSYALLDLKANNKDALLADIKADVGTYDQIRLTVDSVSVKTKAGATKTAKLPSGELKINTELVVKADATASANFDFFADKSLHMTGNGNYIFAPVVKTETKSEATVTVESSGTVNIGSGKVDDSTTVGMDIDGSVKANFQLDTNVKLDVTNGTIIKVKGLVQ